MDGAATGANNGTSWANAFTSPLSANDAADDGGPVAAGDTVWIKGFDYTVTHNQPAWELGYGTANNRTHYYFTNGVSTIYCAIEVVRYTDLIGGNPASLSVITKDIRTVPQVTNTWLLHIDRHTNLFGIGSGGKCIVIAGTGNVIQQVQVTGARDTVVNGIKSDSASDVYYDMSLKGDASTSNLFQYCWINLSSGWGAGAAITYADLGSGPTRTFGSAMEVSYCLIETNGSDGINFSGYVDIHHCIIRTRAGLGAQGCNDTFTMSGEAGNYVRIHHNMIEPADNSLYYLWGAEGNIHDFYFYDNLLTPVISAELDTVQGSGVLIQQQGSGLQEQDVFTGPMYFIRSNVVVALNTDPLTTNMGPNSIAGFLTKNAAATGNTNSFTIYTNAYSIEDNLVVEWDSTVLDGQPRAAFGFYSGNLSQYGTNDAGQGWFYNSNSIIFDFNQAYSYVPGNTYLTQWGSSYTNWAAIFLTNSADVQRVAGYTHNSTAPVTFKNPVANSFAANFQPVATAQGTNLSGMANMPDIGIDLYGQPRSTWMGAIEPDASLVLWLTFDQGDGWTTNHVITDKSGYGNNAVYEPSANHRTWPTWTNGPGTLSAARFSVNWTNAGFHYGEFAAVTNVPTPGSGLQYFTAGTWSVWAEVDIDYALGYSGDEQFLTTGQDQNNWFFGNYYSTANTSGPQFSRASTTGGQEPFETYARFPNIIDSTWHHYVVTFDGLNFLGYLDGQPWTFTQGRAYTNSNSFVYTNQFPGTLVSTNVVGGIYSWIGIGVNTHGNPPQADNSNNGFLQGSLADPRIYNRALSSAEIQELYEYGGGGGSPPAPVLLRATLGPGARLGPGGGL